MVLELKKFEFRYNRAHQIEKSVDQSMFGCMDTLVCWVHHIYEHIVVDPHMDCKFPIKKKVNWSFKKVRIIRLLQINMKYN